MRHRGRGVLDGGLAVSPHTSSIHICCSVRASRVVEEIVASTTRLLGSSSTGEMRLDVSGKTSPEQAALEHDGRLARTSTLQANGLLQGYEPEKPYSVRESEDVVDEGAARPGWPDARARYHLHLIGGNPLPRKPEASNCCHGHEPGLVYASASPA